jgi:hypothetical protein
MVLLGHQLRMLLTPIRKPKPERNITRWPLRKNPMRSMGRRRKSLKNLPNHSPMSSFHLPPMGVAQTIRSMKTGVSLNSIGVRGRATSPTGGNRLPFSSRASLRMKRALQHSTDIPIRGSHARQIRSSR